MVPKCQVCCNKLPKAFISGDFKVTARLSMCSAISGYFQLISATEVLVQMLIGNYISKYPLTKTGYGHRIRTLGHICKTKVPKAEGVAGRAGLAPLLLLVESRAV